MNLDPEALARANRQMIVERAALLAERDRLQKVINQRGVDLFVPIVEALGVLVTQARTGDKPSRELLALFAERLEQVKALDSGIVLLNGSD